MSRSPFFRSFRVIALLAMMGGLVTSIVGFQTVNIQDINVDNSNLNLDEEAYYEYVAPRLERLVIEVDDTEVMVESKSRDIMALSRAGTVIETLTDEIQTYGKDNGVPPLFADVHTRILSASETVNGTFDEARTALRTFNFSGMSDLVGDFSAASDEFTACQNEIETLVVDEYQLPLRIKGAQIDGYAI